MNAIIFGSVSGVVIAAAGSSIIEQPIKTLILMVIINVAAHLVFESCKP